ncbi:12-dihydroxy-3-keto-5-methylthiopentene dioxygenase, partial [Trifolium medium]|nr:12-dihydroxy-3-keto-5-methylthiopentene dioxygenase [Trifolium medium]
MSYSKQMALKIKFPYFCIRVDVDPREEVIQAWYMDDSNEDQRLPHHKEPKEFVSLDQLAELGVLSWKLDADNPDTDPELKKIREERGYSYL